LSGNCGLAEKFSAEDCFPDFKKEVPGAIILFEVTQVGVEPEAYFHSGGQGRSIKRDRIEVRKFFGIHEAMVTSGEYNLSPRRCCTFRTGICAAPHGACISIEDDALRVAHLWCPCFDFLDDMTALS